MEDKHTPGPWRIVRSSKYTGDADDTEIMSVEAANGQTMLFTDSGYFKPMEANARLIAAAPELLGALEALVEVNDRDLKNGIVDYAKGSAIDKYWKTAKAAIKKAKGE